MVFSKFDLNEWTNSSYELDQCRGIRGPCRSIFLADGCIPQYTLGMPWHAQSSMCYLIFLALWPLFSSTSPTKHTNLLILHLKVDFRDLTYICHAHFYKYGQVLIIFHFRSCRTFCTEGNRGIGSWSIEVSLTLWVDAVAILIWEDIMRLIVID